MINFDYLTLKAFIDENIDFLIGSRLQKIQQPTRRDFILSFRNFSESKKMYININPTFFHLCFINDETLKKRNIELPKKPPMFCMLLRKYIESARVIDVKIPNYERIMEIDFQSSNEFNENINLTLSIEMMDKYSNIILYNTTTKIILGCAHNVGADKSREREVSGTIPYIYPPKQKFKKDIITYTGEINYTTLNNYFLGISKSFQEIVKKLPLEKIKDYVAMNTKLSPAIDKNGYYSIYSELLENPILQDGISSMIDNYYSSIQEKYIFNQLQLRLKNIIGAKYKRVTNSLKKINYQISKKDKGEEFKKYGDLILANLYNGKDFTKQLSVIDYETEQEIIIPLDEEKTLKENSSKYYKLYAKSKSSREKLDMIQSNLIEEKEYLEQIQYSIENAENISILKEILLEIDEKTPQKKSNDSVELENIEINGFKVYIGKNNRQNDIIVSKISRAEDYWFHTQNCAGSHILLKVTDNREPDDATIYECCKLAKKYSTASLSSKIGVIYTKRKYLKKPPAAKLGYVTYKKEQEIIVSD